MHNHADHSIDTSFGSINTSFVIAVIANLLFTVLEAVFASLSNSASLLADAGHNLSDVLGLLLAWGASYLATRSASDIYSYGFRRTTILAALVNAIILIFAAVFIAVESIEKLANPTPVSTTVVMVVAGIGILVNGGTAMLFLKGKRQDLNLQGAFLHLAYDALISIGVVLSAVAMYFTGWLWLDGAAGVLIVVVIIFGTWGLLRDSVNLMLDAVPGHINRHEVHQYLETIAGVSQVHDLHIWALSTHETCLTAHLVMPGRTLWDSETGYSEVVATLKEKFKIQHVTLQVEKAADCVAQDCN